MYFRYVIASTSSCTIGNILMATLEDVKDVLPSVTDADNGKFLRVVNGGWTSCSLENAEEVSF